MTPDELQALVDDPSVRKSVSAVEMVEAFLERCESANPTLHAVYDLFPDSALAEARHVDALRSAGQSLPLDGMPILVKDNIDVAGSITTSGAGPSFERLADVDAGAVQRIRRAGGIVLGKAALHELAFGVTTNNAFRGTTRNPWDVERIPGGSSGGSGAAVAADLCIGSLGTDTGGSVRIPAALNGVTGLRPTISTVPTTGMTQTCWTLDTIGPLARSVTDVEALMCALGHFGRADGPAHQRSERTDLVGVRVGRPTNFFADMLTNDVASAVDAAADVLRELGATLVDLPPLPLEVALAAYFLLLHLEAHSLHAAQIASDPSAFSPDILRRLQIGNQYDLDGYLDSMRAMSDWQQVVEAMFEDVHFVLSATTDGTAPRLKDTELLGTTSHLTRLTAPWSMAAVPALSLPAGLSSEGLPMGVQVAAARSRDQSLLWLGELFQSKTSFHRQRPSFVPESELTR